MKQFLATIIRLLNHVKDFNRTQTKMWATNDDFLISSPLLLFLLDFYSICYKHKIREIKMKKEEKSNRKAKREEKSELSRA